MAYNSSIPQANQLISNNQSQILANFQAIDTVNSVNHVAYNASGQGKHKFMQMPAQGSDPTTGVAEGALYTKVSNSLAELFYRPESAGTTIQLTKGGVSITAANGGNGYSFLPGGLKIQWGKIGSGSSGAKTFPTPFTNFCYGVSVTIENGAALYGSVSNLTKNGFTWTPNLAAADLFFIAIGD